MRAADTRGAFGTSVFSEMSRLAAEHQAINLGQGFPDFAGPDFVKDAAKLAIDADLNQYAASQGAPRLRRAIADDWSRRFGHELDAEREVSVTTGATEGSWRRCWRSSIRAMKSSSSSRSTTATCLMC